VKRRKGSQRDGGRGEAEKKKKAGPTEWKQRMQVWSKWKEKAERER